MQAARPDRPTGSEQAPVPAGAAGPAVGRGRTLMRVAAALAALAALLVLGRYLGGYLPAFSAWVQGHGVWGVVAFILGYALATVAFVPGSVLTLAAGAIFGVAAGTAYVFVGAVLGSSAAFLVARYLARPTVERHVRRDARFERIDRAVQRDGRKITLLLRLSPVLPYNLLNYALGLTRVRFRDYLVASVGMLPATALYVYSGRVAGDIAALAGGADVPRGGGYYLVLALGLVATAVVTVWVTRIAHRALNQETLDGPLEDA
jgi:uncharacterized membrane protein YdjX (TVP38/TMEM64 family)